MTQQQQDELEVPRQTYDRIAEHIASTDSPVGIDAKKTHVIIIQKLLEIERRLDRLEQRLSESR